MGPTREDQEFFNRGLWGWLSSQWRKLSMLWGYSVAYLERVYSVDPQGVDIDVDLTAVPAGYVRVIRDVGAWASTVNPELLTFKIMSPGTAHEMRTFAVDTANFAYGLSPDWILEAGQYVKVTFYGCAIGDDLCVSANGYDMAVS